MCLPLIAVGLKSLIVVTVFSAGVTAQTVTSTLHNGKFACVGSRVTFTCVTMGSSTIAWTSDEYIAPDGAELLFSSTIDNPGITRRSSFNPDTTATLIREDNFQGTLVLELTLNITVLADPRNASVTCVNENTGNRRTANFQAIEEPSKPEDVAAVQIQRTEGICVVHTLWRRRNGIMTNYQIFANGTSISDADIATVETTNGTRISAFFPTECAAHVISVSASNVCGLSPATPNLTLASTPLHKLPELEPEPGTNPTDSTTATNAFTENPNTSTSQESTQQISVGTFVAVVVVLLMIILLLAVLLTIVSCCYLVKKAPIIEIKQQDDTPIESKEEYQ